MFAVSSCIAILSTYCIEMAVSMRTQEIEMASDGDINVGSNTEITVGVQTGDQVQGIDQAVESVEDNNADAVGQQDHAYGSGGEITNQEIQNAAEVPRDQTVKDAYAVGPLPSWYANMAVSQPLYMNLLTCAACVYPCLVSKLVSVLFPIAVIVPSIILIALNAVGPLKCNSGGFHTLGILTISTSVLIPAFAVGCVCWSYCFGNFYTKKHFWDLWLIHILGICCLVCVATPILVILSTAYVFVFPPNYQLVRQNSDSSTMCQLLEMPAVTVAASYLLIALLCLSMTVSCCYICKQKRKHNIPVCHCRTRTNI